MNRIVLSPAALAAFAAAMTLRNSSTLEVVAFKDT
jgi:hypothetical protein